MSFAQKIKLARTELGFTQAELARQAGLCLQSIYKLEKSLAIPRPTTIQRLAEVLHVSTRYLSDDSCEDPVMDIERDIYFQNAQQKYRSMMRRGSPVLASDCQTLFSRTDLSQRQKDALFETLKQAYLSNKGGE